MKIDIGSKLLQLRKERGQSIREVSKRSGISANAISLIERNKTSPTIATLTKLILSLDKNPTFLFEEYTTKEVVYIKGKARPCVESKNSKVILESLGSNLPDQKIEPLVATFKKGAKSGRAAISHEGNELVYCLAGLVQFEIDGERYLLEPGDSLFFNGMKPHMWINAGRGDAKVLAVMGTKHWLKGESPRD